MATPFELSFPCFIVRRDDASRFAVVQLSDGHHAIAILTDPNLVQECRPGGGHGCAQLPGAQAPAARKARAGSGGCYEWAADLCAFAVRISMSMDCTAGETALCLARQAGPGPRM